jgi:hypothetical protein
MVDRDRPVVTIPSPLAEPIPESEVAVSIPRAPAGAGDAGRRLWRAVLDEYELAEHELALLRQAVRVADTCEALQAVVSAEGELSTSRLGEVRAHPALVELRAQRILLARLVVALRVPLGDQEEAVAPRTQRRGLRGVYGVGSRLSALRDGGAA